MMSTKDAICRDFSVTWIGGKPFAELPGMMAISTSLIASSSGYSDFMSRIIVI